MNAFPLLLPCCILILALDAIAQEPAKQQTPEAMLQGYWVCAGAVMAKNEEKAYKIVRTFQGATWQEKGLDLDSGKVIYDWSGTFYTKGGSINVLVETMKGVHPWQSYKLHTVHRYDYRFDNEGRLQIIKVTGAHGTIVESHERLNADSPHLQ